MFKKKVDNILEEFNNELEKLKIQQHIINY